MQSTVWLGMTKFLFKKESKTISVVLEKCQNANNLMNNMWMNGISFSGNVIFFQLIKSTSYDPIEIYCLKLLNIFD